MFDDRIPDSHRLGRRRFLEAGIGVATTTLAVPVLSEGAAAHFPNELAIDIRPDCEHNRIDATADGVIPVVVYATEFTDEDGQSVVFDPTARPVRYRFGTVDTVEGGGGARPAHGCHVEDLNDDGNDDLVLHFPVEATGFEPGDTTATLLWERDETGKHGYSGSGSVTVVEEH